MRALTLVGAAVLFLSSAAFWFGGSPRIPVGTKKPARIVSLAPGITETLFTLGLGEQVAGVTSFCAWPAEAGSKPKVGGFQEINLEAIARLRPDLVVLPDDMSHFAPQIEALGAVVLPFNIRNLAGYKKDVLKLGEICGADEAARKLARSFDRLNGQPPDADAPTTLFVLLNPAECGRLPTDVTAIGRDGFYDELLRASGSQNAYRGKLPYPRLSLEAIMKTNPAALIIAAQDCPDVRAVERSWLRMDNMRAVRNKRVLFLTEAGDTIPGPRSLATLQKISRLLDGAR